MNNRMQRDRHSRRHRRSSKGGVAELQPAVPEAVEKPPRWRPSLWLVLLLCLAGSSLVSFVVFKHLIEPGMPSELVGSWEVTAGPMRGATLDFQSDGTAQAVMYKHGRKATTHSTAKVEGKTLFLTTRDEKTGKEETVTQMIVELTADELVLRDEDQMTYPMKRVRK